MGTYLTLQILVTEAIHVFVDKRIGITIQRYPLGNWSIHPYFVTCYILIGIFLFGSAAQQTITNICKYAVGRLRPHFIDICSPNYTTFNCHDASGQYRFVEEDVCTNTDEEKLKEMR